MFDQPPPPAHQNAATIIPATVMEAAGEFDVLLTPNPDSKVPFALTPADEEDVFSADFLRELVQRAYPNVTIQLASNPGAFDRLLNQIIDGQPNEAVDETILYRHEAAVRHELFHDDGTAGAISFGDRRYNKYKPDFGQPHFPDYTSYGFTGGLDGDDQNPTCAIYSTLAFVNTSLNSLSMASGQFVPAANVDRLQLAETVLQGTLDHEIGHCSGEQYDNDNPSRSRESHSDAYEALRYFQRQPKTQVLTDYATLAAQRALGNNTIAAVSQYHPTILKAARTLHTINDSDSHDTALTLTAIEEKLGSGELDALWGMSESDVAALAHDITNGAIADNPYYNSPESRKAYDEEMDQLREATQDIPDEEKVAYFRQRIGEEGAVGYISENYVTSYDLLYGEKVPMYARQADGTLTLTDKQLEAHLTELVHMAGNVARATEMFVNMHAHFGAQVGLLGFDNEEAIAAIDERQDVILKIQHNLDETFLLMQAEKTHPVLAANDPAKAALGERHARHLIALTKLDTIQHPDTGREVTGEEFKGWLNDALEGADLPKGDSSFEQSIRTFAMTQTFGISVNQVKAMAVWGHEASIQTLR